MKKQLEQRIADLKVTLQQRNDTIAACVTALRDANTNRDRVAGGIVELEYALEQAASDAPADDKIKGQIPTAK